ncbi:DUF2059 domain-containing protein [Candidatus Berkiella cookevillensis]|uniref:DUF2059 domain-containing protein n=1 Tax=Candidatus Berkiella cookevillensis TaxID=437022 RepID=A0A0Q9YDF6_9GAMM|nr:DUF2059 domain-containing protein [Candidatus Berkiella cookevillensis]MCS5707873.1 DUF2059 domain-containing protein [Candidatus Berkiella cookevillensis]
MKKAFTSMQQYCSYLLIILLCGFTLPTLAAAISDPQAPSPLYVKVMKNWATTTNFAENASQVAVDKFERDLKKDPQLANYVSKPLLLDLKQFFYELFNSQETMLALASAYSEYYSIDELQELVKFYETPLGKKLISTHPALSLKTQAIGDQMLKNKEKDYIEIVAKYIAKNARSQSE